MAFREKVKRELKGFSKDQIRAFAWRSAVRSLPILGYNGHLDYWKKEQRQRHLFSIFNVLNITNTYVNSYAYTYANDDTFDAAVDANNTTAAYSVANAAAFAFSTAAATNTNDASAFAAAVAAFANAAAFFVLKSDLKDSILQDLKDISANKNPQLSKADYGIVWDHFLSALEKEGCAYWGRVYEKIFENNFAVDQKELKRRLSVPDEIKEQGAAAVGDYLEELEKGAERLNEARIIVLGDKGAGKTCIARRLKNPEADMTTPSESTAGVDTSLWVLEEEKINVRIWDFAGHTVTHAVHQFFLSDRCLYIMVYDGRTEKRNRLEYWLNHMKNYGGNSQAIILVNERDHHPVKVPINYLKEQFPIAGFYSFNVDNDKKGLANFTKKVADFIKNNPSWKNQEIPTSYYHVKEELEKRFNKEGEKKGQEHIEKEAFMAIAREHEVEDPKQLLKDLHHLGISLWYEGMDKYDTLVLNPEWISQGVYKIINWVSQQKTHDVKLGDFSKAFEKETDRFPKDKHQFLFDLIKHYELAFETGRGKRLIIPHLLKEDQPAELPEFKDGESLQMKYEADMPLPPNTISRFIVRHNEQIKKNGTRWLVWKYGVILEDEKGSLALVREIDRTINVSVKGQDQTSFISQLRETLNAIFESYKSKQPELTYRIIDPQMIPPNDLWLPESAIVAHGFKGKPYYDYRTDSNIPMEPTVKNYNITNNYFSVTLKEAKTLILGGGDHQLIENNFNFHDCNIGLQGNLNELARKLSKSGHEEDAQEISEAAESLQEIEEGANKEEVKRKGVFQRLGRIFKELGDEDSSIRKAVEGVKYGVDIVQDMAGEYNKIAEWLALPQVPKVFLKKEKDD